jgi:hypothetical protein
MLCIATSDPETFPDDTEYPGIYDGEDGPTAEGHERATSPLDLLFFFMPRSLWTHIAKESNRYYDQHLNERVGGMHRQQRAGQGRDTRRGFGEGDQATQGDQGPRDCAVYLFADCTRAVPLFQTSVGSLGYRCSCWYLRPLHAESSVWQDHAKPAFLGQLRCQGRYGSCVEGETSRGDHAADVSCRIQPTSGPRFRRSRHPVTKPLQLDGKVSKGQAAQVGNQCVYDLLRRHCVLSSVHVRVCCMFVCLFSK